MEGGGNEEKGGAGLTPRALACREVPLRKWSEQEMCLEVAGEDLEFRWGPWL